MINLEKGQRISMDKGLSLVGVGLGWDPNEGTGFDFDLDRFVKSNKPYFGKWGTFCYICTAKQGRGPSQSVQYTRLRNE